MKQVLVFFSGGYGEDRFSAYSDVLFRANGWLAAHPEATIIGMSSSMAASTNMTTNQECLDFSVTLIVERPGQVER